MDKVALKECKQRCDNHGETFFPVYQMLNSLNPIMGGYYFYKKILPMSPYPLGA